MSSAKKCDRCKKFYTNCAIKGFTLRKGFFDLDLCPECRESLDEWFEKKKKKDSSKNSAL